MSKPWGRLHKGDPQFEIFTTQKWGHPTVFEIDSWNFLQMLDLGFCETSQNFSSFRQLFFIVSKGVPKEKTRKPKKAKKKVQPNELIGLFVHFPILGAVLFLLLRSCQTCFELHSATLESFLARTQYFYIRFRCVKTEWKSWNRGKNIIQMIWQNF